MRITTSDKRSFVYRADTLLNMHNTCDDFVRCLKLVTFDFEFKGTASRALAARHVGVIRSGVLRQGTTPPDYENQVMSLTR